MNEQINKAVEAAGDELRIFHGWGLDDDNTKPVLETLFAQVVLKHVMRAVNPESVKVAKAAKIAALRAEIEALEGGEK